MMCLSKNAENTDVLPKIGVDATESESRKDTEEETT